MINQWMEGVLAGSCRDKAPRMSGLLEGRRTTAPLTRSSGDGAVDGHFESMKNGRP